MKTQNPVAFFVASLLFCASVSTALAGTPPPSPMVGPYGLALDQSGNLYVADGPANVIWKITGDSKIALLAGDPTHTAGSTDGRGPAARFNGPGNFVVRSGTLYVTDFGNNTIRTITSNGTVRTLAGSASATTCYREGTGVDAAFYLPLGIAVDDKGQFYVADAGNGVIRKLTTATTTSWLSGERHVYADDTWAGGISLTNNVNISVGNVISAGTSTITLNNIGAILTGGLIYRSGSATTLDPSVLDGCINLGGGYFFDSGTLLYNTGSSIVLYGDNLTLLQTGTLTPVVSGTTQPAPANALIVPEVRIAADTEASYAGDAYSFNFLCGMALSPNGDFLYACTGTPAICSIRISDGTVTPLDAALFGDDPDSLRPANPANLRFDSQGNVYIADTGNSRILKIAITGGVTCVAGGGTPDADGIGESGYRDGPGAVALFSHPTDIAIDSAGNVYVADKGNGVIRKIDAATSIVTTLALEEVPLASINNGIGNTDSSGGGGGGALSVWYLLGLAALGVARLRRR